MNCGLILAIIDVITGAVGTISIIDVITGAVGIIGIAIATITYRSSNVIRRKEALLPLMDKFDHDSSLKLAKLILDDFSVTEENDPEELIWIEPIYDFSFSWNKIMSDDVIEVNRLKKFLDDKFALSWVTKADVEKKDNIIKIRYGNKWIVIISKECDEVSIRISRGNNLANPMTIEGLQLEEDEVDGSLIVRPNQYYHKNNLAIILRHHHQLPVYDTGEIQIRSSFSSLLNFFFQLEYMYDKLKLIKKEELTYFATYIKEASSLSPIGDFIREYEFPVRLDELSAISCDKESFSKRITNQS